MSRELLTFGYDACHRWTVFRFAGFEVHECESIRQLRQMLMESTDVAAVIMVEDVVSIPEEAIIAAGSYFHGPLVLFEGQNRNEIEKGFHLQVPILTEPSAWLQGIQDLIQNHQSCAKEEHSERVVLKNPDGVSRL